MNVLDAIYTRRSIRRFTGEVISDEEVLSLLNAGFAAPSANNHQPWEFIVVKDMDKMIEIENDQKMLSNAGCGIVICGNKEHNDNIGILVQDCSAAVQNILLAAHGMKLGAVWCNVYPNEDEMNKFRTKLNLPGHIIPMAIAVVGHKTEEKEPEYRYDERKVHYNTWTKKE